MQEDYGLDDYSSKRKKALCWCFAILGLLPLLVYLRNLRIILMGI